MAEEKTVEETSKSGLNFKIIIAGLVIFLIAMGASYFLMKSLMDPLLPKEENEKTKEVVTGNLIEVGEFTTNIGDIAGTRFVKVEIFLEVAGKKGNEDIDEFMPIIKDSILSILSSKSVADLEVRNRERLKQEIKQDLNTKLGKDSIKNVYFTSFIMQ